MEQLDDSTAESQIRFGGSNVKIQAMGFQLLGFYGARQCNNNFIYVATLKKLVYKVFDILQLQQIEATDIQKRLKKDV